MVSMNYMPAELLSIPSFGRSSTRFKRGVNDLLPPYHFPFNLASVCTAWRDVLSRYPEYWTNLYVLVDAIHPTSLSELALYLQYSKHLALKLIVSRSPVSATSSSLHEEDGTRIRSAVEMLRPHFRRCTWISFDAKDLAFLSPDFSTLILSCEIDDAHPPIDTHHVDVEMASSLHAKNSVEGKPPASALTHLELSGYTIMDVIQHSFSLLENETAPMDITLSTYNLTTDLERQQSEHITRTFFRALDVPGRSDKLTLRNINLPYLGDEIFLSLRTGANVDNRELRLDTDDCKMFPYNGHLSLVDLNSDINLCPFFECWAIGSLAVSNCKSFNDDVIRLLVRRRDAEENLLDQHQIINCPHVTVAALRELAGSGNSNLVEMESISVVAPAQQISTQEIDALEEKFPGIFEWFTIEDEESSKLTEVT
ncbi:hypothetical protein CPB83DRAFT_901801 [Crepidotus variabilis]|uniref:Uncharacterized protein n=1 Tax=Crepidotus variabilis TaxID=179855 RepID=A0A9P6JWC7_9AGAR|nr:hypothetical protein CPB83DRAFT_901801 [Crepidotus variabilis]